MEELHNAPIKSDNNDSAKANSIHRRSSVVVLRKLSSTYLVLNQAAYAIIAFPIGTVLSIGPILLNELKNVPLERVGLFMAGGEALGIVAMKMAEMSTNGFIVSRPHDLHLIVALTAVSLILMPIWPSDLWYLPGITMMLVQVFNSASKPVIGESLYRLATIMEKDPIRVFAQANMFRRIGNACVGSLTPLIYALSPSISFYAVGVSMLLFLVVLLYYSCKIDGIFMAEDPAAETGEDNTSIGNRSANSTIHSLKLLMIESQAIANTLRHYYSEDSDDESSNNKGLGDEANYANNRYPGKENVVATSALNRPMKKKHVRSSTITKVELKEEENTDSSASSTDMPQVEEDVFSEEFLPHSEDIENHATPTPSKAPVLVHTFASNDNRSAIQNEKEKSTPTRKIANVFNSLKLLMIESQAIANTLRHYYSEDSDDKSSNNKGLGDEANYANNRYPGKESVVAISALNRPMKKKDVSSSTMTKVELKEEENTDSSASSTDMPQVEEDVFSEEFLPHSEDIENYATPTMPIRKVAYILIVHAFPFWDAAISRLPFTFLTVAIAKDFSMSLAAGILFAYQFGRALSQFIQVSYCTPSVGYILNSLTLVAYALLVIYIEVFGGKFWFVPFAFLGLSETLAIQQFYLLKLFDVRDANEDNMELRHAVKASHTGTGVGSMAAFIASSRIYTAYGIRGASYLGLSIQLTKIVTNLLIDWTLRRFKM